LLVGADAGLDVTAVVEADEFDRAPRALDVEAAGGVLLLGPHQEVRLLADLGAAGPRAGAGDRVADADRLRLRAQDGGHRERRCAGADRLDGGATPDGPGGAHRVSPSGFWWPDEWPDCGADGRDLSIIRTAGAARFSPRATGLDDLCRPAPVLSLVSTRAAQPATPRSGPARIIAAIAPGPGEPHAHVHADHEHRVRRAARA